MSFKNLERSQIKSRLIASSTASKHLGCIEAAKRIFEEKRLYLLSRAVKFLEVFGVLKYVSKKFSFIQWSEFQLWDEHFRRQALQTRTTKLLFDWRDKNSIQKREIRGIWRDYSDIVIFFSEWRRIPFHVPYFWWKYQNNFVSMWRWMAFSAFYLFISQTEFLSSARIFWDRTELSRYSEDCCKWRRDNALCSSNDPWTNFQLHFTR